MNEAKYAPSSSSGCWVVTAISLISIHPPHGVVMPVAAVLSATVPNSSALVRGGFQFSISTSRQFQIT